MDKFWSLFWRLFGIALLAALAVGIALGVIRHSAVIIVTFIRAIIAIGLGITGIIGGVVVPIEMYCEDRAAALSGKGGANVVE